MKDAVSSLAMRRRSTPLGIVSLLALVGLVASPSACGLFGTRITRGDCDAWTTHYLDVAKRVLKNDFAKCGLSEKDIAQGGGSILKSCQNNAGQPYEKKDAQCYRDGSSLEDWKACGFGPATIFHGFENAVTAQRGFLEDLCAK